MYRIQVRQSTKGKPWYYRIISPNGRILLTSETYANKPNAKRAAAKFIDVVRYFNGYAFIMESDGE